jgi:tetratricopeptide (TPR) repeat protein
MTVPSPCPDPEALERLLLGDMPDVEMEALEGHVSRCPRCLEVLRAAEPEDTLVAAVRAGGRAEELPREEVDETLIARLCRLQDEAVPTKPVVRDTLSSKSLPAPGKAEELSSLLAPPGESDELGRIGAYGVLCVLGSGGAGIVFAARQARPRRVVALKMILADPRAGRERLERFRGESEVLARLRHPNIVQVYEVAEHRGRPFFTMEYVEGGSLAQKLAAAPLVPRAAAELIQVLARAAHSAHEQGFVHRDLKPSNVLLETDGTPRISDFGLAKQLNDEPGLSDEAGAFASGERTETGAILGTPGYMAPEQAAGRSKEIGPAADVYALGAILYECLTGRPPFRTPNVLTTLEQVRTQEPVAPARLQPGVPRDLQTICLACLEKEPRKRYRTALELAADLGRFLRGEPIRARPAGLAGRLVKWARRRPALAALVGVCVLAVTGMIVGAAVYERRLRNSLQETAAERERANANYRQARDTLRQILEDARGHNSEGLPKLRELQRQQQEKALAFFRCMAEQQGDNPEVRLDVAGACLEAAEIQVILGQPEEALRNQHKARDLLAALIAEFPQRPRYRLAHAHALHAIARSLLCPPAEGDLCLQQALEEIGELTRTEPENVDYRVLQATIHHQLGICRYQQDHFPDAEAHYRQAAALAEELSREQPEVRRHRVLLAHTHINLCLLLQNDKRDPRESHDRAEAVLEQLQREEPNDEDVLNGLTTLRINWAYKQEARGDPEAALADLAKNVPLLEEALRLEPKHARFRDLLWRTHGVRGQILTNQKRFAEAADACQRTVELSPDPATADYRRLFLALAYARSGQHARADKELDDWNTRAKPATPPEQLLHCAVVYGVALQAVRDDGRLASAERDALSERYASRAVALLRKLQEVGYFNDPRHAEALRGDEDLRALRERQDFRQLQAELERGKKD